MNKPAPRLHAAILAAGEARRFGSPKQLAELDGQSLLARAVATAKTVAGQRFFVVTGAHQPLLLDSLTATGAAFVLNPQWPDGPGSSIAAAARALPDDCEGLLIWHADQPLLDAAQLAEIIARWRGDPQRCVCAAFNQTIGAPALFPRRLFETLRQLPAAQGAKALLRQEAGALQVIDMATAAVDIDRPEDLARLNQP